MSRLLTETANYNTPGSWGPASEGWPEITGDEAYDMYVFANMTSAIPYGSYVLMSKRGRYEAQVSRLRVMGDYLPQLRTMFRKAGCPTPEKRK